MNIYTRLATPDDLDAVAILFDAYRQFYEQAADLELARSFLGERMAGGESVILVAEDDNASLLGFCQLYPTFCSVRAARTFTLYDLYVSAGARQHGAGRCLMQAAEHHARMGGAARLDLTTAKTNVHAQALYESMGWQRDDVFYAYSRQI